MCVYATQAKCINNNTLYTHTHTRTRIYASCASHRSKRARAHVKHSIESGWSAYARTHTCPATPRSPAAAATSGGGCDGGGVVVVVVGNERGMCERTTLVPTIFRKVKDKECNRRVVDEVDVRCYGDGVCVHACMRACVRMHAHAQHCSGDCNIILNRQREKMCVSVRLTGARPSEVRETPGVWCV